MQYKTDYTKVQTLRTERTYNIVAVFNRNISAETKLSVGDSVVE